MSTPEEGGPLSVVQMLDGRVAVIERNVRKDEHTAIYTVVLFDNEQAAEAWRRDRRAGKAEEHPLPRETFEASNHGPPFDEFWQDIHILAYMLDGEAAENRRERIAHFLKHTTRPKHDERGCSVTLEDFRRAGVLGLLNVWLDGPVEPETQEHFARVIGAAMGVKTFAEMMKKEIDDDGDKGCGAGSA